ncbi:PH domain-containing protein [Nocardioides sp. CER19]|uniref:PH domain-containing protein n=1 Tax=Nocardioides sp. CER19 TaxID=3038538 RepID=UPI00244A13EE|nr:PH domain-containing protein [Nocardioides sp. CER19]MDH2415414.1 PH domain-containing protein [Nocardioides sp. CER19]
MILGDPDVTKHLLREEGEVIVDEVRKHWVAYLRPMVEAVLAVVLLVATSYAPVAVGWLPFSLAGLVALHAVWLTARARRDVFVITNMRVFRVHGVLTTQLATMPLSRILDITVSKPLHGRLLGFGHFIFESASQGQGLRDVKYVGRPDQRDLAIQRVVQHAGLRGPRTW